jgi:hypothetical protein
MFTITGCGDKETDKENSNNTETKTETKNSDADKVDSDSVEGILAKAGLDLEDIKPDTFAEASTYLCDQNEIIMYITNDADVLGEAVTKPMIMKILDATADIADDGKYWDSYYGFDEPTELDLSETNWDAWFLLLTFSYKKDGEWINVTLSVVPAEEPAGENNYEWEVTLSFLY